MTLSKLAQKDLKELSRQGLGDKIVQILDSMQVDPFYSPPPFKKLKGEMEGMYSRRLNVEHRIVYKVLPSDSEDYSGVILIIRMRTHYKGLIPLFLI